MIDVVTSFLLSFPPKPSERDQPEKGKRLKLSKKVDKKFSDEKKKKKRGKKKLENASSGETSTQEAKETSQTEIKLKNPIGFAHIIYDFAPQHKSWVDVICWESAAKIIHEGNEKIFRTYEHEGQIWVSFSVRHSMSLTTEEKVSLKSSRLNFSIWPFKKKLGSRAQKDKTSKVYFRKEDVEAEKRFMEGFVKDPNFLSTDSVTNIVRSILEEIIQSALEKHDKIDSLTSATDSVHKNKIYRTIEQLVNSETITSIVLNPAWSAPASASTSRHGKSKKPKPEKLAEKSKKKKRKNKGVDIDVDVEIKQTKKKKKKSIDVDIDSKKSKGKTKSKKRSRDSSPSSGASKAKSKKAAHEDILSLDILGEVYFTEPIVAVLHFTQSNRSLNHALVFLSTSKILTKEENESLKPFKVKVKRVEDLPYEILKENNFTHVCTTYDFENEIASSSVEMPIERHVCFYDNRIFFTNGIDRGRLLEFFQSKRMVIKIQGKHSVKDDSIGLLFGKDIKDSKISAIPILNEVMKPQYKVENDEWVTIATADFDLSQLVTGYSQEMIGQCYIPERAQRNNIPPSRNAGKPVNTNEINYKVFLKPVDFLKEHELLWNKTAMVVEFQVDFSVASLVPDVQLTGKSYNRLFLIAHDSYVTASILRLMLAHNQEIVNFAFLPDLIANLKNAFVEVDENNTLEDLVTGFVIDCGDSFIFFFESLSNGYIQAAWQHLMNMKKSLGRVFFNSELTFTERLYADFFNYGGILIISLNEPLEEILIQEKTYLLGYLPIPCAEAVRKIDLLGQCFSMREMCQFSLFPTAQELMSLYLEWCSPSQGDQLGIP